ncbi:hypothetical protein ELQ35_19515 [Peribacillus cavernae]|uniref:Anti-sigma-W factor RsiW n=1 Tax=Peribacillus cavernae TaxID=1674310 RepID=A0A433HCC5_9BACI|nr:anti-sigma factor [Peribacillus cavernae]MDQ0219724.1 hypothetical protein [Peribacillus cavernae]RUQ25999.1 hypothetical protein ELQ35_19515 [Peribacillus cavernae]
MNNNQCDLLVDYFNGQLDDISHRKFEQHLLECEDCRKELTELRMLTENLPFASEPVDPPSDMKDRILANVFQEKQEMVETEIPEQKPAYRPESERKNRWLKPLLAASLFLSLVGNAYALLSKDNENDTVQESKVTIDKFEKTVSLQPSKNQQVNGTAMLINKDGKTELVVQADNLKNVTGSQVYQVWLLEKGKPYRAGTFVPGSEGQGAVTYGINHPGEHQWDTVAITLEPSNDSKTPKGEILLSSAL